MIYSGTGNVKDTPLVDQGHWAKKKIINEIKKTMASFGSLPFVHQNTQTYETCLCRQEAPTWNKMDIPEEAQKDFGSQILQQIPLGRMGRPDEIANAALFLASNESPYVNGVELPVDGGMAQV